MRRFYQAKAIIWDQKDQTVFLQRRQLNSANYLLPFVEIDLYANGIKELKRELHDDNQLQVQFQRTLPDTWSRLLFLHTKTDQYLKIYYVFEYISSANKTIKSKQDDNFWAKIADCMGANIEAQDLGALEYFKDICAIINTVQVASPI